MELGNIFTIIITFFILFFIGCLHHMLIAIGLLMNLTAFYKAGKFICELKLSTSTEYEDIIKNIDESIFKINTSFRNKNMILLIKKSMIKENNLLKLRSILEVNQSGEIKIKTYYDIISTINLFIGLTLLFWIVVVFFIYLDINFFTTILFLLPLYTVIFYFLFRTVISKNRKAINDYINNCQQILNKCGGTQPVSRL